MPRASSQQGFSLIEVLVAVLIVAIGLLGVAGMQLLGLKSNQQSFSKNQAAQHAQAILEKMRGNPEGVFSGHYVFDSDTYNCEDELEEDCTLLTSECSTDDIAAYDLFNSYCGIQDGGAIGGIKGDLSHASLDISCASDCASGIALELGWSEQVLGEGGSGGEEMVSRQLTINTVIGK